MLASLLVDVVECYTRGDIKMIILKEPLSVKSTRKSGVDTVKMI